MSALTLIIMLLANVLAIKAHLCNCDCPQNNALVNQHSQLYTSIHSGANHNLNSGYQSLHLDQGHQQAINYLPSHPQQILISTGVGHSYQQPAAQQAQLANIGGEEIHKEQENLHLNNLQHNQLLSHDQQNYQTHVQQNYQTQTLDNSHQEKGHGEEEHHDDESSHHHKKDHNIHYKFEYAVNDQKTHDIKQQKEERSGDVVKGEYSLLEEDGNVRTVKYYADWKTGFHAQVLNSKKRSEG